jgi:predicted dehydrogenase
MSKLTDDIHSKRRIKIGMIGGGKGAFFAGYHRAAMRITNRYDIVAGAFSSDPAVCDEAAVAFGVAPDRNYYSFADLVRGEANRDDRIDVALIVTPNHLHFEPCRLLLEAGIPVICDKPLVNSLSEARQLVALAEKKACFFAMTYTYLGYPMVRDARTRILNGEIGDIRFMYVEYLLEWLAGDSTKLGKGGVWRGDPKKAGPTGALGDVGTHAFNLLEFLSDKRCVALNAKLTTTVPGFALDDTDVIQLEFNGGVDGLLWSSLASPGHRNGLRFKIVGSKATLEWSQEAPETLLCSRLGQADIIYRRGLQDMTPTALESVSLPAGNPEAYLEALAVLYADMADALDAGSQWREATVFPLQGVEEGLRGVALSENALRSNAARAWVPFTTD